MNQSSYAFSADLDGQVRRLRQRALMVGAGSLGLSAIGAFINPAQFFRSYLVGYMFFVGLSLGCMAILMLQYLTGGAWGLVIRRILEAATRNFPLLLVLFLPLVLGISQLYIWSHADVVAKDEVLRHKSLYLNVPFFLIRAAVYFGGWIFLAFILNKWSLEHDRTGDPVTARRLQLVSGPGLAFYGLSMTFAAVDWVMSIEPHWFSTIFGMLFVAGQGLSALAFVIIVLVLLADVPPLRGIIGPAHLQDIGKLMLAFVMVWAYFSFSQFLIIWAGNLTEEIPWYMERVQGGWQWVGLSLILLHFALPFALLLSRSLKRNARTIIKVAALLIGMRFVDLFWLVAPDYRKAQFGVHWLDLVVPLGLGGIWVAAFLWQLGKRPLLPVQDAHLEEAIAHGEAHEYSY